MHRALLLSIALLTVPIVGCVDTDDDPTASDYEVTWDQEPGDRSTGEANDMSWTVDGPEFEIPHTGVHWADRSVDDPTSPADYGNTSGAVEPAEVPGTFETEVTIDEPGTYYFIAHAIVGDEHVWSEEVEVEVEGGGVGVGIDVTIDDHTEQAGPGEDVTVEWSLSGVPDEADRTQVYWGTDSAEDDPTPGDYANQAGTVEDASIPGSYDATFNVTDPGVYHLRAHALHDGTHYWSDEVTFEIAGEEHEVDIVSISTGFDPAELTVQPGDTITWTNTDSLAHTVTFDDETLGDSGDIPAGDSYNLTIPADMEPGTYEYVCDYHATMTAQITVEEA